MAPGSLSRKDFLIALCLAFVTGLVLLRLYPFPVNDGLFMAVEMRSPKTWWYLSRTYQLFLFTTPLIAYAAVGAFLRTHVLKAKPSAAEAGELPPYPDPRARTQPTVVLGEVHHPTQSQPSSDPGWLTIPEKGLYTNLACFGAVGSGKTSSFIRPVAQQLLAYAAHDPKRRMGGIFLEVKGDFCQGLREDLDALGRGDDYLGIGRKADWLYNPLANPELSEDCLAYAITTLIANIYGHDPNPFWPMASSNVNKFLILLHRLVCGWVTLTDVYETAIDPDLLARKLAQGCRKFHIVSTATVSHRDYGAHAEQLGDAMLKRTAEGWQAPADKRVIDTLKGARVPFDISNRAEPAADVSPDDQQRFIAVKKWFDNDWTRIDNKLRTSIVEGISVFLSLFDTNPAIKRIFCPPREAYDPAINRPEDGYPMGRPLPPFADLIEDGKVLALDFPHALDPVVARTVGVLMKLDYQRAVLMRVPRMAAEPGRHYRPTVFMADEYQNFVTTGEFGTGDQSFFSLSRQAKCIGVIASQSIVSLKSALANDDAYRALLQTFRNKCFLTTADDVTAEYASRLAGREDRPSASYSFSESGHDASVSSLTGRSVHGRSAVVVSKTVRAVERDRFPVAALYDLKNAQAIVMGFDGVNPIKATYCYLKPHYLAVDVSWWQHYGQGRLG